MRVLIIEDNTFNAFCLRRMLESVVASVSVTVVDNSQDALSVIALNMPDLVIMDGELKLINEWSRHGPQLAAILLEKYPHLPVIAWTDSEFMREAFVKVFMRHNLLIKDHTVWAKVISPERIRTTMSYYFGTNQNRELPHATHLNAPRPNSHLYQ